MFVNFIVALEEDMAELTGRQMDLADTINAAETHYHPVSTVGELIDFLCNITEC